MSWQRPQKTVKHVMAPYTEGGRYKKRVNHEFSRTLVRGYGKMIVLSLNKADEQQESCIPIGKSLEVK